MPWGRGASVPGSISQAPQPGAHLQQLTTVYHFRQSQLHCTWFVSDAFFEVSPLDTISIVSYQRKLTVDIAM